jgi:hypothetical protein
MDRALIIERLKEAENALHQLMIGGQPVEVRDQNGEAVKYTPANASRLRAYIAELKQQLGQHCSRPLEIWM